MTTQNEDIAKTDSANSAREVDLLRYRDTKDQVPRFLRLAWTLMGVFTFYYLGKYMWPDLLEWLAK